MFRSLLTEPFALHNPLYVQYAVPPAGNSGSADGTGAAASFYAPSDVAIQPGTNSFVYVADSSNNMIRQVTVPGGVVTTLAGQVRRADCDLAASAFVVRCLHCARPSYGRSAPPHPLSPNVSPLLAFGWLG